LLVNTTDSIWAFELAQQATVIAARLGLPAVRFAPGPLAGREDVLPPRDIPLPSMEQVRAAAEIASVIADQELREKVQKAVSLGLARGFQHPPV
jgi:hypothetical protein